MAQIVNLLVHKMVSDRKDWVSPTHFTPFWKWERAHWCDTVCRQNDAHEDSGSPRHPPWGRKKKTTHSDGVTLHLLSLFLTEGLCSVLGIPSAYLNIHTETLSVQAVRIFPSDLSLWQHISKSLYGLIFVSFFLFLMIMFLCRTDGLSVLYSWVLIM